MIGLTFPASKKVLVSSAHSLQQVKPSYLADLLSLVTLLSDTSGGASHL